MPGGGNVWDRMSEDDRNDTIANKLKSGELEIVYARPGPNGLYYVTVRPPKEKVLEVDDAGSFVRTQVYPET